MKKVIYYINQFFGGIGGEEMAGEPYSVRDGLIGPSMAFNGGIGELGEVVKTIVCGDNYFNDNQEEVIGKVKELVAEEKPDLFVAGPAFNAGRYGFACATLCKTVKDEFGIPVLTGMYIENPGSFMYRKELYIISTGNSAADMRKSMPKMISMGKKLLTGEKIGSAAEEGYIPRGFRLNTLADDIGAVRAVRMLHKKLAGEPYQTEVPVEKYEEIPPAPPIEDLSTALIAFVTEAGVVPMGNPDHIKHASATNWAKYSLEGVYDLVEGAYEGVHGGFDARYCNADPDRVMPVDALRYFEKEGVIGKMYETFYSTVGNGTPIDVSKKFGAEIAKELKEAGVQGVLVPSS